MITYNQRTCPKCNGDLKYHDSVKRILRTKQRETRHIILHRYKCRKCNSIHRELPDYMFPYKQYESEVIIGVLEGLITSETLGYEDYPCEMTMQRWRTQKLYKIL